MVPTRTAIVVRPVTVVQLVALSRGHFFGLNHMDRKLSTHAGCLLLLLSALAPVALGHDERIPLAGSYLNSVPDGISGRYVGAATVAVAVEGHAHPENTLGVN